MTLPDYLIGYHTTPQEEKLASVWSPVPHHSHGMCFTLDMSNHQQYHFVEVFSPQNNQFSASGPLSHIRISFNMSYLGQFWEESENEAKIIVILHANKVSLGQLSRNATLSVRSMLNFYSYQASKKESENVAFPTGACQFPHDNSLTQSNLP